MPFLSSKTHPRRTHLHGDAKPQKTGQKVDQLVRFLAWGVCLPWYALDLKGLKLFF